METLANPNRQINKRINAALFDAACFAVICFVLNVLLSLIVGGVFTPYKSAYETYTTHIENSNLCKIDNKNGYLNYSSNELSKKDEEGNLIFCDVLSYYYLNYLSNTNLKDGLEGSEYIVIHDIEWFNKTVLEMDKKDLFKPRSSNADSLSTEIGVFNDDYLKSNGVNTLYDFIENKYNEATTDFYNLPFIKEANKTMNISNSVVLFSASSISLLLVYVLIPCISKSHQSFGKKIFKVVIVKNDALISKPVLLLRAVPALLVCVLISIINDAYSEIGIVILALLISSGFMFFTRKNNAIHDYVAGTSVISAEKFKEMKHEN